jgi:predicted amidohydrolase
VEALMSQLDTDTDVVVLPELFSTGYITDVELLSKCAEPLSGATMQFIRHIADKYNVAIAGSYLAIVSESYYNRGFFIEPSGEETIYDKRHLFSLSRESKIMDCGNTRPPIIRFRGWNISLIICYDLHFPVWCRNIKLAYDAMLVPANWPTIRSYAWKQLLIGRAIENQAYYIGANRIGEDSYGTYDHMSYIADCDGQPIGEANGSGWIYAVLDRDKIDTLRQKFPAWNDADEFHIL